MSALGHKRTCAVQKGMSALPPKADIAVSATAQSAASTLGWVPVTSGAKVGELS